MIKFKKLDYIVKDKEGNETVIYYDQRSRLHTVKEMIKKYTAYIIVAALFFLTVILPYMLLHESWSSTKREPTVSPMLWFMAVGFWIWLAWVSFTHKDLPSKRSGSTVIDNRGAKISTQNNYAEKMAIKQNTTVKQMVMSSADKQMLKQAFMHKGKYQEWLELEPKIKIS